VSGGRRTKCCPAAHLADQNERYICGEGIEGDERVLGDLEFDVKEYGEEQDADNQHDVDVDLVPSEAGCLVPGEIEQDHGCDAYCGAEQV
jgi:hypothetical protein